MNSCPVDKIVRTVFFFNDTATTEIYTSGANNIFRYPELADTERASMLINTIEEKSVLADFIKDSEQKEQSGETGIKVYIGEEGPVESMKDCSVVTATYELGDGLQGTIGIIGPKRMDYEKVMNNLKSFKASLGQLFRDNRVVDQEDTENGKAREP